MKTKRRVVSRRGEAGYPLFRAAETSTSTAIPVSTGSAPAPAPRAIPTPIAATRNPAEKSAWATCMTRGPPEVSTLVAATLMTTSTAPVVIPTKIRANVSCHTELARPGSTAARPKRTSVSGMIRGPTRSTIRPVTIIAGSAARARARKAMPSSVTEASTCSLTSGTSTPQAPQ